MSVADDSEILGERRRGVGERQMIKKKKEEKNYHNDLRSFTTCKLIKLYFREGVPYCRQYFASTEKHGERDSG